MPRTRADAREALGVPAHARLILVSGGGWGIGNLEGAIDAGALRRGHKGRCIAGRNKAARGKLEQSIRGNERVRVLGFTEQMSDWMAAADAMVHSTAGLTVLEAHIRGCPVVSYGFSAGHLRANNTAFERFGLAEVARSERELESVLRHLTRERRSPDSTFASLPSIASRVLTARPRIKAPARLAAADGACGDGAQPRARGRRPAVTVIDLGALRSSAKPLKGRIHIGKDGRRTGGRARPRPARPRPASEALIGEARRRPASAAAGARRPGACPDPAGLGRAWGSSAARRARGVALTFDDGPHPQGTPMVLEVLREAGATATFFLAGEQVVRRPALAAEIVAAGHRVELHCHRHRNLLRLTAARVPEDAERARAAIEEASGQAIAHYRPPMWMFSAATLRATRRRGWRPVLWSRWGRDWKRQHHSRVDRAARGRRRQRRRRRSPP